VAESLGEVLANTMTLQVKTQVYHWNVVGPAFYSLHKLTEEHYNDLFAAADVIAERIRALGHITPLSNKALTAKTDIDEETSTRSAGEMVEQLIEDHEQLIRDARMAAKEAGEAGDMVTEDMLIARLAFHEQAVWMLRAIAS
jgi:starvation-inducible DNA-binding protein